MAFKLLIFISVTVCLSAASPATSSGASWHANMEEMRSLCAGDDPIACLKFKAFSFLDRFLKSDKFQLSEYVEVSRNNFRSNEVESSRSEAASVEDQVVNYLKTHDVTFNLPLVGKFTFDARSLDNEELDIKMDFNSGNAVQESRKHKMKKMLYPLVTIALMKLITGLPFFLGIIYWMAQVGLITSVLSFIASAGMAIFALCKKLAADNTHPHIAAHSAWEPAHAAARSFFDGKEAQEMAYSAYGQQ